MPKKILVVDDEVDIVALARTFLMAQGYQVVTASNGDEGIAKAASEKPDLILLDVLMPGKSGFEVTRALKANPSTSGIPIVISTVLTGAKDHGEALDAGAVAVMAKPFDFKIAGAQIRNILEMRELKLFGSLSDINLRTFMLQILNSTAVETENLFGTGSPIVFLRATKLLGKQIIDLYAREWKLSKWTPELLGKAGVDLVSRMGGTAKLAGATAESVTIEMPASPFGNENIKGTEGHLCDFVWNVFPTMAKASGLASELLRVDHTSCIGRGDTKCTLVTRLGNWKTVSTVASKDGANMRNQQPG